MNIHLKKAHNRTMIVNVKNVINFFINNFLILIALNLFSQNLGNLSLEHSRFFALTCLLILLIKNINFPVTIKEGYSFIIGIILTVSGIIVINYTETPIVWLSLYPIILFGLDQFLKGFGSRLNALHTYLIMGIFYTIIFIAYQSIPSVWRAVQEGYLEWSSLVGKAIIKQPIFIGPSAGGFWILVSMVLYLLASLLPIRRFRPNLGYMVGFVSTIAILILLNAVYLFLQNQSTIIDQTASSIINSQVIYFVMAVILVTIISFFSASAIPADKNHQAIDFFIPMIIIYIMLLTIYPATISSAGKKIFLHDDGFLDWDRPVFGKYGPYETGMFGSLVDYLHALGYETGITKNIIDENLSKYDVVTIINPTRQWSRQEETLIWQFVKNGGSLLVLGDHTNIAGSQKSLNQLLKPVNITFNFDSAYPSKPGWIDSLSFQLHPINTGIQKATQSVISVGASLDIAAPAFPIIIGRYGFSDLGNILNQQGAFLGNYKYEKGEQLGDVVLVAGAYYGKGKVLVFGDTSPLQNTAFSFSLLPFTHNIFQWLTCSSWVAVTYFREIGLVLLIILFYCFFKYSLTSNQILLCAVTLAASLGICMGINHIRWSHWQIDGPLAIIDRSHGNRISIAPLEADSIGGLITNLLRNGYLPVVVSEFPKDYLSTNAKLYIVTAPTKPFNQHEQKILKRFMEAGGYIIFNIGWEQKGESAQSLFDLTGMDIARIPLGPYPVIREKAHLEEGPQFINAWPVTVNNQSDMSALYQAIQQYRQVVYSIPSQPDLEEYIRDMMMTQRGVQQPRQPGLAATSLENRLMDDSFFYRSPQPVPLRETFSSSTELDWVKQNYKSLLEQYKTVVEPVELSGLSFPDSEGSRTNPLNVIYKTDEGLPLILLHHKEKGGAILIGDTFFLGNDNLENMKYYRKGNILFLKYLFNKLKSGQ